MKKRVNKHFYFLLTFILILVIGGVYASWDITKKVFHSANDVKVTIDGADYSLQELINSGAFAKSNFYFGGMYSPSESVTLGTSVRYDNKIITNGQSCPEGYMAKKSFGSSNYDPSIYVCIANSAEAPEVARFGGMYGSGEEGTDSYINPITGSKTCPPGYTSAQILGTQGVDYGLFYCYADLNTAPVAQFGGIWSPTSGSGVYGGYNTISKGCPVGYQSKKVFGHSGVDYTIEFCYK